MIKCKILTLSLLLFAVMLETEMRACNRNISGQQNCILAIILWVNDINTFVAHQISECVVVGDSSLIDLSGRK